MRRLFVMVGLGLFSGLGGCTLFGGGTATPPSPETTSVTIPAPVSPGVTGSPTTPIAAAPQTTPPGTATPASPVGTLPPDLIPSNDANQRVRSIQRNRPDPFALVPTIASIEIPEPTNVPARIAPAAPGSYNPPVPPASVSFNPPQSRPTPSVNRQEPGQLAPIPNLVPSTPVPPPPPQPTMARAVEVSGIVQIGNVPYAIVKAPNEPTSRYVRVGQSLSDGEVLVKRIVTNQGAEPFIVLEQYGIEVVRSVGEGGAAAASNASMPTG